MERPRHPVRDIGDSDEPPGRWRLAGRRRRRPDRVVEWAGSAVAVVAAAAMIALMVIGVMAAWKHWR